MDNKMDDELKKRIREVFEDFEDASADEGWLLLRERFPEKAKRRPAAWIWWGSVAALLLLFTGILWYAYRSNNIVPLANNKNSKKDNVISKGTARNEHKQTDSSRLSAQNQLFADSTLRATTRDTNSLQNPSRSAHRQAIASNQRTPPAIGIAKYRPAIPYTQQPLLTVADQPTSINKDTQKEMIASIPLQSNNAVTTLPQSTEVQKVDSSSNPAGRSIGAPYSGVVKIPQLSPKTNIPVFAYDNPDPKKRDLKSAERSVRFSIYAATYFNYAKGSGSQLNVGAGVTSDIKLSEKLRLSTGASIAQNTLNFNTQLPSTPQTNSIALASTLTKTYAAVAQNYGISAPSFRNYNASLIGVDIPINLKYVFDPQKSETYVSLGLSSGAFINESYNYSYDYPAPFTGNISQIRSQSTSQNFNSFYFAKTLNFAFGTSYSLGKTNRLIIEPFIKYPLDGLGSQQIRFGAGGLNLKFNFPSLRK